MNEIQNIILSIEQIEETMKVVLAEKSEDAVRYAVQIMGSEQDENYEILTCDGYLNLEGEIVTSDFLDIPEQCRLKRFAGALLALAIYRSNGGKGQSIINAIGSNGMTVPVPSKF